MPVKSTVLLPADGALEELPIGTCPHAILESQVLFGGVQSAALDFRVRILTGKGGFLGADPGKVNALSSVLTGQLIRGDAVLTVEHRTKAEAEVWIRHTALQHSRASSLHPVSAMSNSASTLPSDSICSSKDLEPLQQRALPSTDLNKRREEAQLESEKQKSSFNSKIVSGVVTQQKSSASDICEPRSKLLWTIVGQASSVSWEHKAKQSQKEVIGLNSMNRLPMNADMVSSTASKEEFREQPGRQLCAKSMAISISAISRSWADLQPELLAIILSKIGTAASTQPFVGVCRQWRLAAFNDKSCLRKLPFNAPATMLPFIKKAAQGQPWPSESGLPITTLIDKAAHAGNVAACRIVARFLDDLGMREEGMRYWKRAAKLGDPASLVVFGTASYSGIAGVVRDSEAAYRWLSKAANKLASLPPTVVNGDSDIAATLLSPSRYHFENPATRNNWAGQLMARAALHLGFLVLDGEAAKMDLETAVSWFRLASKSGSRDAEIVLGTLLRTGQYGPS